MKILVTEPESYGEKSIKILSTIGQLTVKKINNKQLEKIIEPYSILVIGHELNINSKIIKRAKHLKIIATSTTGIDHIDLNYAKKKGIQVISLKGQTKFLNHVYATAEHTMALLLALIRKIPWAFDEIRKNKWQRKKYFGSELHGKILGIIGLGRLGKKIAHYGLAFGMKVVAFDPYVDKKNMSILKVDKLSKSSLLKNSDIIVVLPSLNPLTINLIDQKEFKLMKKNCILINTSRGKIVNENALLDALRNKKISAAAIDVLNTETRQNNPLLNNRLVNYARKNKNLLITPHIAGATAESLSKTSVFIANKIKNFVKKK